MSEIQDPPIEKKHGKSALLLGLAAVLAAAALGAGCYWTLSGSAQEATDDAYVAGNIVQVTPQIAGTVRSIDADDTDLVKAGAPLVILDRADVKVALEQAEAQLAQTVRQVRTLYSRNESLAAAVTLRQADLSKAQEDLNRRLTLAGTGGVSNEEIEHGRVAVRAAEAALSVAREQLATNQALTAYTSVTDHPNVKRAAAQVERAYLAYRRTVIPAPVGGIVARRSVQVGSRVAPGQPLMSIVPLDQVWVNANFKEEQLQRMRIGQPVTLTSDIYGSRVVYHGTVAGLAAGTGSAFSLLPAQNASGNWIKVVQRVPVRIAIARAELKAHPLRIGLSMQAKVEVDDQSGAQLAEAVREQPVEQTQVYDDSGNAIAARVRLIIEAQLHGGRIPPLPQPESIAQGPQRPDGLPGAIKRASHKLSLSSDKARDAKRLALLSGGR